MVMHATSDEESLLVLGRIFVEHKLTTRANPELIS